jgi:iron complex outermembrane receptor protein
MKSPLVVFIMLFSITSFGQSITGSVLDEKYKPIPSASIALQRAKDSSIVKISLTDSLGRYAFSSIDSGSYFLTITHTGYLTAVSPFFKLGFADDTYIMNLPGQVLEKQAGQLQKVVVTAKKPLVEGKADKTIVNVEGSVNAVGLDALELLRKSPGVLLDRDDNISLGGKNGTQIYIDGRPTPLVGKDLADYLKSLSSNAIEAIEIITNPSAQYDASGNGGIINIRLKKSRSFGTNGSLNLGYNLGIFPKYNGGFSANHRNKHINLFGNYSYHQNNNENFMSLNRDLSDTLFAQRLDRLEDNHTHNFKAGLDYLIDKKSTIGIVINGTESGADVKTKSNTAILNLPAEKPDRLLVANNTSDAKRHNLNFNLNYVYADTAGMRLNINADYGNYRLGNNQHQPNHYYDPTTGSELYRVVNSIVSPSYINIYSLKADYERSLGGGKMSVGGKTSYVNTNNHFEWYDIVGNDKKLNVIRSNFFEYAENVQALYLHYNRRFTGIEIQAGLRMENTGSTGKSYSLDTNGNLNRATKQQFRRKYTDFFPSAAITFSNNPISQFSFTYSRRIDRPAYQDLNPFEFKVDEYNFQKGNTELRPQYTSSVGIAYTYNYKLNTSLNYSRVKDVFAQLVDTIEKSKSFLIRKNMATQRIISFNINYPFSWKWYSLFANINTYYSGYIADFGPGRKIDLDVYVFNMYMQNSFNLGKDWRAEISGWYVSPSLWQGISRSSSMWSMDAGLQKNILKGAISLKVSVSDIFQSMRWKGESNFTGQHSIASGGWESRLLKLSCVWRFGNTQMKEAARRNTGAEDENKRVKESNEGINRQ